MSSKRKTTATARRKEVAKKYFGNCINFLFSKDLVVFFSKEFAALCWGGFGVEVCAFCGAFFVWDFGVGFRVFFGGVFCRCCVVWRCVAVVSSLSSLCLALPCSCRCCAVVVWIFSLLSLC